MEGYMNIKVSKKDVIWGYLGYILKVCSNIILLPLILKKLTTDELGVWYVFISIGALIQLLDLGFTPTIMRNISYAFGGATQLQREGIAEQQVIQGKPNYSLINQLIKISKKIYMYISIVALLLLFTIGTYYIKSITQHLQNSDIIIAWYIYSIGIFLNFYYSYWIPVLGGIGKIKESQKATVVSQLAYLLIGFVGIMQSFGLIAISLAFAISGIILREVSKYYFKGTIPTLLDIRISPKEENDLFNIVWYTARQIGIVFVGSFLIVQANTLLCASYFDLQTTAQYGLTLQLFNVVATFASIMFRSYLPIISEARVKKSQQSLKQYLSLTAMVGWLSFFLGSAVIVLCGNWLLHVIGSKTTLLPQTMLLFMAVYLFLEFNHGAIFSTFIITNNEVPFVKAALFSGTSIVVCSLALINLTELGLWSVLISQALVQGCYNNWKWPKVVLVQLNTNLWQLICQGFDEIRILIRKKRGRKCDISSNKG